MHIKWNGIIGDVNILKNCIMSSNLIKERWGGGEMKRILKSWNQRNLMRKKNEKLLCLYAESETIIKTRNC